MLVLSRRKNESIVIADDVVITVVEIRGDKVRLGIVAPKEIDVHRQEVWDVIKGNKPDPRKRDKMPPGERAELEKAEREQRELAAAGLPS